MAQAAVSADEARQLGSTLTEFGAIKAGNADGTIPIYTGSCTGTPDGFKPDSGFWVGPFTDDQPLMRIDARNMAQYADKLSDGQQHLLRTYPTSCCMDVYPSPRSAAYPDKMLKATLRNATTCNTTRDGVGVDKVCGGGFPFPIPKTGLEMIWNQVLRSPIGRAVGPRWPARWPPTW